MYFESHAHYNDKRFDKDRELLLGTLLPEAGIEYIINASDTMNSVDAGLSLAEKYPYVYVAVGVHPHEVKNMTDKDLETLRSRSTHEKAVAIGEIGLDFYYDNSPRDLQRKWFKKQLQLAKEVNLPVVIHSRDAAQECYDIIAESGVRKGVIHCYSGSAQMALDYVNMGFYIGIGGVITFDNSRKLIETAEAVPLNKILIETDCPYLSPAPNRGKRNDSRNLQYVVEKLGKVKNISVSRVLDVTKQNGKQLFFK